MPDDKKNKKKISGVYISDGNEKRVMTKLEFKRKQNLRGNGKGMKPSRWSHYKA